AEVGLEEFVPLPDESLGREVKENVPLAEQLSLRRRQLVGERFAFDDGRDGALAVGEDHVLAAGVEVSAEALSLALARHVRLELAGLEAEVGGELVQVRERQTAGEQLFEIAQAEVAVVALGPEEDDRARAVVVEAAANAEEAGSFAKQLRRPQRQAEAGVVDELVAFLEEAFQIAGDDGGDGLLGGHEVESGILGATRNGTRQGEDDAHGNDALEHGKTSEIETSIRGFHRFTQISESRRSLGRRVGPSLT